MVDQAPDVALVQFAPGGATGLAVDDVAGSIAILAAGSGLVFGPLTPLQLRDLARRLHRVASKMDGQRGRAH